MRIVRTAALQTMALSILALAACDIDRTPRGPAPLAASASSGMEFRGERACVDCLGIESWLRLEHDGGRQHYRMVEDYHGEGGDRRFEDAGEWTAAGETLRLQSREGGVRVYARLADGRLQARGARGQPLPAARDDVLVPVTFDQTQ